MKLVQCPDEILIKPFIDYPTDFNKRMPIVKRFFNENKGPMIFLGGGITSCPEWQTIVIDRLKNKECILINPKREHWNINKELEEEQVKWEHWHLYYSNKIIFWFPKETLCPITLFELGKHLLPDIDGCDKKLYIGLHPEYAKKDNVIIQIKLERPFQVIHDSLDSLIQEISLDLIDVPC